MPGVLRIRGRAPVRPRHQAGAMNRLERRFLEEVLLPRQAAGEVHEWWFGAVTLKLADDCRYTPDYFVVLADGYIECYEIKGFWRDDARVKVRVAAAKFPFRFVAASWSKKAGWEYEEF